MLFLKPVFILVSLILFLAGCMPVIHPPGEKKGSGLLLSSQFITEDGVKLPVRQWLPQSEHPRAVIVALHGFNDYSHFFQLPGKYFSARDIACFAYDQRGFGQAPQPGLWAGISAYTEDAALFVHLIREKYPAIPVYLLGESMGAAVVVVAQAQRLIDVDGIILSAPAVWGRETMPWYQTAVLWTLSHSVPWMTLTGESVDIIATDNSRLLTEMAKDPLIIKETRVETIYGLVNLMDAALNNAHQVSANTLILYGEKDEVIPKAPTALFVADMLHDKQQEETTVAVYPNGYHMLLRDLQAQLVWDDILGWINNDPAVLTFGSERWSKGLLKQP